MQRRSRKPDSRGSYTLSADEFITLSTIFDPRGSVTTSCGAPADGRRAILKCVSDAVPDGRYNPESGQSWIDSADVGLLKWDPVFKGKIKAFGFGITDAADTPTFLQPDPFWRLAVEGATIDHPRLFKDEGEPVTWYTVVFDKPVSTASLLCGQRRATASASSTPPWRRSRSRPPGGCFSPASEVWWQPGRRASLCDAANEQAGSSPAR